MLANVNLTTQDYRSDLAASMYVVNLILNFTTLVKV